MVPPFIAYYGALKGGTVGRALLEVAYNQCRLYRDALRDDSGLWRHITLGSHEDTNHWATGHNFDTAFLPVGLIFYSIGNAWAAAGMLRVLATMNHTSHANKFQSHQLNLTSWIDEILEASWAHQVRAANLSVSYPV